jgi:hypothetical protein
MVLRNLMHLGWRPSGGSTDAALTDSKTLTSGAGQPLVTKWLVAAL